MSDFPKRVVLGEGYPWAYGPGPLYQVGVNAEQIGVVAMPLCWPAELWDKDVPRYRLVLELVEDDDE